MRTRGVFQKMAEQVPHRPGPLKQQNKPHKHGKHQSKSQMSSMTKGGPPQAVFKLYGIMLHLDDFMRMTFGS